MFLVCKALLLVIFGRTLSQLLTALVIESKYCKPCYFHVHEIFTN